MHVEERELEAHVPKLPARILKGRSLGDLRTLLAQECRQPLPQRTIILKEKNLTSTVQHRFVALVDGGRGHDIGSP
jgi:hypothetical protein